jgi:hypothetical protein
MEGINRRIIVQASPCKDSKPYSKKKITKAKRAGGIAYVIECLSTIRRF